MTGQRTLRKGEVDVWTVDLDESQAGSETLLSDDERRYAARFREALLRQRWVAGRAALRRVLAAYLDSRPVDLDTLCRRCGGTDHGKPQLLRHPEVQFNVSRSRGQAVVAVARDVAVGVDIESTAHQMDWRGVAELTFTAKEIRELRMAEPPWSAKLATQMWCRKEAVAKAVGLGLVLDLGHWELGGGWFHRAWRPARGPGMGETVLFLDLDIGESVCAALAVVTEADPRAVRLLKLQGSAPDPAVT